MDLKRNRDGIVDAITAEDIGDFPDSNLAESLQRITGVSIDRERGEGARVTVRGFGPDFNLVLLNGRQMPTSSGLGRSFDFGNLASEGISAVEVYKTGTADVPTGGIGATLNIRTTRPLEAPGMNFTAAGSGLHDTSTEDGGAFTPEVSALFSNTFADDTVGIALSAVRQDRNNGANTASVGGWRTFPGEVDNCWCGIGPSEWGGIPPHTDPNQQNRPGAGDLYSVPQNIGYELAEYERVRTNGQLTLQWQASEAVRATLDYTFSEVELERTYTNLSAWFNFGGQETLWTDGPQASPVVYTENLPNSDYSMAAGNDAWVAQNGATGLNLVWDVTDRLSVEFDYHDSTAERKPNSPFGDSSLLSTAAFTRDRTTGHFGAELPVLDLTLSRPLSPDDMIVTGSVFTNNFAKMNIEQFHVGGVFDFDAGFVENIDFGIQLTEGEQPLGGLRGPARCVGRRDATGGDRGPLDSCLGVRGVRSGARWRRHATPGRLLHLRHDGDDRANRSADGIRRGDHVLPARYGRLRYGSVYVQPFHLGPANHRGVPGGPFPGEHVLRMGADHGRPEAGPALRGDRHLVPSALARLHADRLGGGQRAVGGAGCARFHFARRQLRPAAAQRRLQDRT